MSTSEGLDTRHIWNYLCLAYDDWPISPLAHAWPTLSIQANGVAPLFWFELFRLRPCLVSLLQQLLVQPEQKLHQRAPFAIAHADVDGRAGVAFTANRRSQRSYKMVPPLLQLRLHVVWSATKQGLNNFTGCYPLLFFLNLHGFLILWSVLKWNEKDWREN
jgi:hypothetical protein